MRFVFTWLPCWSKKYHYSGVYRGSKFMHFDKSCAKMSQNHTSNLDKVFLNVPPSSDFGLEARILQIGWFYRPKWKKVERSASKNKHPIKLRFLIWRLKSANPEKKVIPENQGFGSCPFKFSRIRKLDLDMIWDHDRYVKASPRSTKHIPNNGLTISDDLGRKSGIFWNNW